MEMFYPLNFSLMAQFSEQSFGARLQKAWDVHEAIKNFTGYAPPRTEESVASFKNLLDDIQEANDKETEEENKYTLTVDDRITAFRDGSQSVFKLLSPLRGALEAQYGKTSIHYETAKRFLDKLQHSTSAKKKGTEGDGEAQGEGGLSVEHNVSRSEQSYGSILQYFTDLVHTLEQFGDFNPTNDALKVANLKTVLMQLSALNNSVTDKYNALRFQRSERGKLYDELSERVQRVKSYVKATYGVDSVEYGLIKGVVI
jgi:hypothetical protein